MATIPNFVHPESPVGGEADARELRRVGEVPRFDFAPRDHWNPSVELARPRFLPIVSANSLAATLARKATGRVDGFVVEMDNSASELVDYFIKNRTKQLKA